MEGENACSICYLYFWDSFNQIAMHQWIVFETIWVCLARSSFFYFHRCWLGVEGALHQALTDINKMKRLFVFPRLSIPRPTVSCRWSAANGHPNLALSPWPVDEPQLRFGSTTRWNRSMVLQDGSVEKMGYQRFSLVDSWQAYVSEPTWQVPCTNKFIYSEAGAGKSTLLYVMTSWARLR